MNYDDKLKAMLGLWAEKNDYHEAYYMGYMFWRNHLEADVCRGNPIIDLTFTNSLLSMKEDVECPECAGLSQEKKNYCVLCNGTGKISKYVIDREKYFVALVKELGILKHAVKFVVFGKTNLTTDEVIAIHKATVKERVEAIYATITQ